MIAFSLDPRCRLGLVPAKSASSSSVGSLVAKTWKAEPAGASSMRIMSVFPEWFSPGRRTNIPGGNGFEAREYRFGK